ncbi:MAG: DUF2490 domain-containing protein [Chitinophagaceae bacterium]|nr:DUF2490 domain-containing protein [Chitinophagaceae bacterium]
MGLNSVNAQATKSDPVDNQGWFSAGVDLDLPKKWKAELEYQARVFNDLKTFNGSFYSIGIEKGLSSWFALQAEYRLSKVLKGTYNRFSAGFVVDKKIKDVKLDLRVIYQNQIQDFDDPAKELDKDDFVRVRIRGKKDLTDKLDAIVSLEPIYELQNGFKLNNYRIQGGFKYHLNKKSSLEIFYINRPDYGKSYKRQYHIYGLSFKQEVKIK